MSQNGAFVQSLRPAPKRLYESSVSLAICLKNHQEATCATKTETNSNSCEEAVETKPTLAAVTRHYRLGRLLRAIAPLIVLQERLYRRLEKRPDTDAAVKKTFPELFQIMENESRAILKISSDFSVAKEDRYTMEANLNHLRDSVERIADAFQTVRDAQYQSPGRLDNKMADIVDQLRVDWCAVQSVRESLPERYPLDFGRLSEKSTP
ncbi:uncharacterized protein LOC119739609 [Patiria miniata]|uniref:Uncharacterized protein n=1 Tax=Patiria miniata TaxID=46514 RepID=A0A914B3L9_PATMI|nr:uncharacterized protein LOC119723543 [Patiria miniata]XP_038050176.1 uncharacterized protein LOC119723544 [Patiria miniata]XP_038070518.1 uncharacterized protein LOC119739609 [Patiria miniata]